MSKFVDQKYYGPEPKPLTELFPPSSEVYSKAFTWYAYTCDDDLKRKWTLEWLESKYTKKQLDLIAKQHISNVTAAVARMLKLGWTLPQSFIDNFNNKILTFLDKPDDKKEAPVVLVQERIKEKKYQVIADFEEQVDKFFETYTSNFEPYDYFNLNQISQVIANSVTEYYQKQLDELKAIKTDKDLIEAYSYLNKKQLKSYIEFMTLIVDDSVRWSSNKKKQTVRKPRKAKVEPASQQVSKMAFQTDFKDLKLVSIDPATIIGATSLWVYNTKTRHLTVYNSVDGGLKVKGTTIKNFNELLSIKKKLRKPSETINTVLTSGKVVLRNLMDTLTTTQTAMNGRINDQTILLRVLK